MPQKIESLENLAAVTCSPKNYSQYIYYNSVFNTAAVLKAYQIAENTGICRVHGAGMYFIYLFKGLWDRANDSPSSRRTGNLAHCCHETGEYSAMGNGPCTPHYRTAQN